MAGCDVMSRLVGACVVGRQSLWHIIESSLLQKLAFGKALVAREMQGIMPHGVPQGL